MVSCGTGVRLPFLLYIFELLACAGFMLVPVLVVVVYVL